MYFPACATTVKHYVTYFALLKKKASSVTPQDRLSAHQVVWAQSVLKLDSCSESGPTSGAQAQKFKLLL